MPETVRPSSNIYRKGLTAMEISMKMKVICLIESSTRKGEDLLLKTSYLAFYLLEAFIICLEIY